MATSTADTSFKPNQIKKIFAGAVGNSLEYVDWALYGLLAPVFASQFFPDSDPVAALLGTLVIYAVGFVARPLGGAVLGAFGDKHGRKTGLAVSILVMSGGSVLIAFAPTYQAVGLLAPLVLLLGRLGQGFAAGGEYGASMSYMVESAPGKRRGLSGSFQQVSISIGILLASVIAWFLTAVFDDEQMSSYGWRVGFLIVAALGIAAYLYRRTVGESDTFEEMRRDNAIVKAPVRTLVTQHMRSIKWVIIVAGPVSLFHYIWVTYLPSYAHTTYGYALSDTLMVQTLCTTLLIFVLPVFGYISDRIGRKPLLLFSCGTTLVLSWPAFSLIGQGMGFYLLTQVLMVILLAPYLAVLTSTLVEHVPAQVRTTGIGLPYAVAVALFGGTAPLIITSMAEGGSVHLVWVYPAAVALIAGVALFLLRESAFTPLGSAVVSRDEAASARASRAGR